MAVINCTGDLSAGITNQGTTPNFTTPPTTTVNVTSLTTDIQPAPGVDGVRLLDSGAASSLTLSVDIGDARAIQTTADGLSIEEHGAGELTIDVESGAIIAGGIGIFARERDAGSVTVATAARSESRAQVGIMAFESGEGDLAVTLSGAMHASNGGVFANEAGSGDVNVEVLGTGNITSFDGLFAISVTETGDGDVKISASGNITAGDFGVSVTESGAGNVTVTASGRISVSEDLGAGIFANQLDDGSISVTSSGIVTALGNNAHGIVTWNTAAGGMTTVSVTGGIVHGGAGDGAGVDLSRSGAGTINVLNAAGGLSALSGLAVRGGDGDDTLNVLAGGVVTGNVDLAGGDNAISIEPAARLNSGAIVIVGARNRMINAGVLAPADDGVIGATALTGDFVQSSGGTYAVDADFAADTADRLVITGAANVSGRVAVTLMDLLSSTQAITILTADGGVTDAGVIVGSLVTADGLVIAPDSQVVDAQLVFPDAYTVALSVQTNFASPIDGPLNRNQMRIADALNRQLPQGLTMTPLRPLLVALINGPTTIDQYRAALDVLLPEVYLNTQTAMLFSAHDFMSDLFSCPTADDGAAFMREGQCVWVRPKRRKLDRDDTAEAIGYEDTVGGVSAGAQFSLAPGWFANVGGSYEHGSLSTDTGAESDSDRYHLGGAVKYEMGPWLFAGAVAGGIGDFDTTRQMAFTGFNETATSDHDVSYIAGQLRVAYQFAMPGW
ncbi:MAG: autotransporter outer membrane beta-barrel domain-containing protein, partial [Pseudomonadota bacterium]